MNLRLATSFLLAPAAAAVVDADKSWSRRTARVAPRDPPAAVGAPAASPLAAATAGVLGKNPDAGGDAGGARSRPPSLAGDEDPRDPAPAARAPHDPSRGGRNLPPSAAVEGPSSEGRALASAPKAPATEADVGVLGASTYASTSLPGCSLPVPCVNGYVTGTTTKCSEACDNQCCVGEFACDKFTGTVCKDGVSCNGYDACFNANISTVVQGCNGESACTQSNIGGVINACNDRYACKWAGKDSAIVTELADCCNREYECYVATSRPQSCTATDPIKAPTNSPTTVPTATPTNEPTNAPTNAPTDGPCEDHTECALGEKCKGGYKVAKKCRAKKKDCKRWGTHSRKRWGCADGETCGGGEATAKWGSCLSE